MTLEEANKVARILEQADDHCKSCAENLRQLAEKTFPEFEWIFWELESPLGWGIQVKEKTSLVKE